MRVWSAACLSSRMVHARNSCWFPLPPLPPVVVMAVVMQRASAVSPTLNRLARCCSSCLPASAMESSIRLRFRAVPVGIGITVGTHFRGGDESRVLLFKEIHSAAQVNRRMYALRNPSFASFAFTDCFSDFSGVRKEVDRHSCCDLSRI